MQGETSGRCRRCEIRFVWKGKPLLKHAICPYCASPLYLTTHRWQGKTEEKTPTSIWPHTTVKLKRERR